MKNYESIIEEFNNRVEQEFYNLAKQAFMDVLLPFLRKNRLEFSAGMGTWVVWAIPISSAVYRNGLSPKEIAGMTQGSMQVEEDDLPDEILEVLYLQGINEWSLGEMMPQYRYNKETKKFEIE